MGSPAGDDAERLGMVRALLLLCAFAFAATPLPRVLVCAAAGITGTVAKEDDACALLLFVSLLVPLSSSSSHVISDAVVVALLAAPPPPPPPVW